MGVTEGGARLSDFTFTFHSCIGEGNGYSLQCSCLENPRDRGAWRVAIYGVAQSRTRLKRLSSNSSGSSSSAGKESTCNADKKTDFTKVIQLVLCRVSSGDRKVTQGCSYRRVRYSNRMRNKSGDECVLVSNMEGKAFNLSPHVLNLFPKIVFSDEYIAVVFSHIQLFAAPRFVAHHSPLSMKFSRQEHWGGLLCCPSGDLPNPGTEPSSLASPALVGFFIFRLWRVKSLTVECELSVAACGI
ncbi:hypothetical protein MG293_000359 [Ovis ammon polii]|uniref:Uncharacterized protein n=1 Tax=Ovis ammon polii TaxID=230172 RepID=A0AAD4UPZ5_OVIAM|nr:hypothetical protein MG293_000359 [Ovis ammon polii]